jgi:lipopolysaccharide/colanic/teichoic acid biosynthesis glycosyltransferase
MTTEEAPMYRREPAHAATPRRIRRSGEHEHQFRVGPMRRFLDVVIAAALLLLSAPVLLVVAVLLVLDDGRPVLYRQVRVGEGGRPFRLTKLRSMRVGAPGAEVTATGDSRITRLGRFLRRSCLDEVPQLWHVLRGQMTLVGPRPESLALAERYPADCRQVLLARPGLTGPAQLRFRERSALPPPGWTDVEGWYLGVVVPARVRADLVYLRRPTLRATVRQLVVTALFVVGLVDVQSPALPAPDVRGTGRRLTQIPSHRTPEG